MVLDQSQPDIADGLVIQFSSAQTPIRRLPCVLILSERAVQRMRRKIPVWFPKSVVPIATPRVTRRVVNHIRPHWVELDIALAV